MIELHLPWLELAIALPASAPCCCSVCTTPNWRSSGTLLFSGLALACSVGAWLDFGSLHTFEAHDRWSLCSQCFGSEFFVIDEFSAPLLPMAALISFVTTLATLRTKVRRYPFAGSLVSRNDSVGDAELPQSVGDCRSPGRGRPAAAVGTAECAASRCGSLRFTCRCSS